MFQLYWNNMPIAWWMLLLAVRCLCLDDLINLTWVLWGFNIRILLVLICVHKTTEEKFKLSVFRHVLEKTFCIHFLNLICQFQDSLKWINTAIGTVKVYIKWNNTAIHVIFLSWFYNFEVFISADYTHRFGKALEFVVQVYIQLHWDIVCIFMIWSETIFSVAEGTTKYLSTLSTY